MRARVPRRSRRLGLTVATLLALGLGLPSPALGAPTLRVAPASGQPGALLTANGSAFPAGQPIKGSKIKEN